MSIVGGGNSVRPLGLTRSDNTKDRLRSAKTARTVSSCQHSFSTRELVQTIDPPSAGWPWTLYTKLRSVLLGAPPTSDSTALLQSFCRNVELTQDTVGDLDLMNLAAAGRELTCNISAFTPEAISAARIAREIARLGTLSPPLVLSDELPFAVLDGLKCMLAHLKSLEVQRSFGPPLPTIR